MPGERSLCAGCRKVSKNLRGIRGHYHKVPPDYAQEHEDKILAHQRRVAADLLRLEGREAG